MVVVSLGDADFLCLREFEKRKKKKGTLTRGLYMYSEEESSFPRTETRWQITTSLFLSPPS